jgi:hypothetical protein
MCRSAVAPCGPVVRTRTIGQAGMAGKTLRRCPLMPLPPERLPLASHHAASVTDLCHYRAPVCGIRRYVLSVECRKHTTRLCFPCKYQQGTPHVNRSRRSTRNADRVILDSTMVWTHVGPAPVRSNGKVLSLDRRPPPDPASMADLIAQQLLCGSGSAVVHAHCSSSLHDAGPTPHAASV